MPLEHSQARPWILWKVYARGFPGISAGKESSCNAGNPDLIPGMRRSPGEGNEYPFQYSPGEFHGQSSLVGYNPWGHKELDITERLSLH